MSHRIVIGPHFLSLDEVRRANEELAAGWKGHRLMAVVPMVWIAFTAKGVLDHPTPFRLGLIVAPQFVLLFATLFLRPYRDIRQIAYTFVLSDENFTLESRVDGGRWVRMVVPWGEIVGVDDAKDAVVLHLRSGDAPRLPKECFDNEQQLHTLMYRAQNNLQERSG